MELPGAKKSAAAGGSGDKAASGAGGKKPPAKATDAPPKSSAQPKKSQPGPSKVTPAGNFIKTLSDLLTHFNQVPVYSSAMVFCISCAQPTSGPMKKGKAASAAGGKAKKSADNKENTESELSVSFSPCICSTNYMFKKKNTKKQNKKKTYTRTS